MKKPGKTRLALYWTRLGVYRVRLGMYKVRLALYKGGENGFHS
jgi:hypothetical protein